MPDFRDGNPYQSLLSNAISKLGCDVLFARGYRRVFPLYRAMCEQSSPVNILHLHWLTPYLRGNNVVSYAIYALKLVFDVWLVRLRGGRIVWTVHNKMSHEARFLRLERWVMNRIANSATCVIFHSNAARADLKEEFNNNKAKAVVIPHGHYRDVYHPAIDRQLARRELDLPTDSRLYLCFGLVRKYKNIEGLVGAWKQNNGPLADSVLLVAGEPLPTEYGNEISELVGYTPNTIAHLRHIPAEQVHLYFSAADIVVLPFHRTLTSGSLLLAMSYDKPIVAPKFDVITEVLGAARELLYDPLDDSGLSTALRQAAMAELTSVARLTRRECDKLSWTMIAEQTVSAYRSVFHQLDRTTGS